MLEVIEDGDMEDWVKVKHTFTPADAALPAALYFHKSITMCIYTTKSAVLYVFHLQPNPELHRFRKFSTFSTSCIIINGHVFL